MRTRATHSACIKQQAQNVALIAVVRIANVASAIIDADKTCERGATGNEVNKNAKFIVDRFEQTL